jgi:hypothetical protein
MTGIVAQDADDAVAEVPCNTKRGRATITI